MEPVISSSLGACFPLLLVFRRANTKINANTRLSTSDGEALSTAQQRGFALQIHPTPRARLTFLAHRNLIVLGLNGFLEAAHFSLSTTASAHAIGPLGRSPRFSRQQPCLRQVLQYK
jgi:hypothetical protein